MPDSFTQMLARKLLGTGMASQASSDQQLYPIYQKEQIDKQTSGGEIKPFEDWKKDYQSQQQVQSK